MFRRYREGIYCFSPPVMLATFAVEVGLALFTIWRYKLNTLSRLVVAMFGFLALFQLAEYMMCGGFGMSGGEWARIGYASITILPALGVHLAFVLAGKVNRLIVGTAYLLAVVFMGYFLFATDVFSGSQCLGNYVIFELGTIASQLYTWYYYGLLLLTLGLGIRLAKKAPAKRRHALLAFVVGYVLFILPTTIVHTIDPATIAGIPSIMCGFAVLLALVVAFWVMPLVGQRRIQKRRKV
jgi:hypothetical protein